MASSISSLFLCPTTNAAAIPLRRVSFSTKCTPPQHQSVDPSPPPPPPPRLKGSLSPWPPGSSSSGSPRGVEDVEAERRRKAVSSPGFSFSAAGLLFPYHLGVAQFLIEKGYIKDALKATKILAEDCRLRGTAFRLGAVLRDVLNEFLPDDVHIRSNGRVRVAVTEILWRPRGLLVDQFDSKEDLINAVFTSSFIPGYLAPRPATMFRNRLCIDGGLTLFMPPTSAAQTVRVCAFPVGRLGWQGIGISPDCNPENRASTRELFNWALEPAADATLDELFALGYLDAAVWAAENPVETIVQDDSPRLEILQTE
ncbi:hypothetical protein DH2020_024095 [Rehmannia glutinosa]|uniref:Patatin n=1 Tax=Rehmannia glutinosa TaxID=99300 RepID=A0ABR0W7V0_REHGL